MRLSEKGRAIFERNKGKPTLLSERWDKDIQLLNSHRKCTNCLADVNTSIYGTYGKIGGSKPQLRHKQVGRIITTVILDARKLKQES